MAVGTGGGIALPDFDGAVTPISTRGTDYAHYITAWPPNFSDPPTALLCSSAVRLSARALD